MHPTTPIVTAALYKALTESDFENLCNTLTFGTHKAFLSDFKAHFAQLHDSPETSETTPETPRFVLQHLLRILIDFTKWIHWESEPSPFAAPPRLFELNAMAFKRLMLLKLGHWDPYHNERHEATNRLKHTKVISTLKDHFEKRMFAHFERTNWLDIFGICVREMGYREFSMYFLPTNPYLIVDFFLHYPATELNTDGAQFLYALLRHLRAEAFVQRKPVIVVNPMANTVQKAPKRIPLSHLLAQYLIDHPKIRAQSHQYRYQLDDPEDALFCIEDYLVAQAETGLRLAVMQNFVPQYPGDFDPIAFRGIPFLLMDLQEITKLKTGPQPDPSLYKDLLKTLQYLLDCTASYSQIAHRFNDHEDRPETLAEIAVILSAFMDWLSRTGSQPMVTALIGDLLSYGLKGSNRYTALYAFAQALNPDRLSLYFEECFHLTSTPYPRISPQRPSNFYLGVCRNLAHHARQPLRTFLTEQDIRIIVSEWFVLARASLGNLVPNPFSHALGNVRELRSFPFDRLDADENVIAAEQAVFQIIAWHEAAQLEPEGRPLGEHEAALWPLLKTFIEKGVPFNDRLLQCLADLTPKVTETNNGPRYQGFRGALLVKNMKRAQSNVLKQVLPKVLPKEALEFAAMLMLLTYPDHDREVFKHLTRHFITQVFLANLHYSFTLADAEQAWAAVQEPVNLGIDRLVMTDDSAGPNSLSLPGSSTPYKRFLSFSGRHVYAPEDRATPDAASPGKTVTKKCLIQ